MILQVLNHYLFVHIPPAGHELQLPLNKSARSFFFFPSFFNFSFTLLSHIHLLEDKVWSLCLCRSALQVLHKACEVSRRFNYFPGGIALTWMAFYESCITSEQSCVNEWNAMTDLETTRPDSPTMFVDRWGPLLPVWVLLVPDHWGGSNRPGPLSHQLSRGQTEQLLLLCLRAQSKAGFSMRWHQLISLCWHQSSADVFDSLCAGRRSGREQSVWSKPSCATSWRSRTWRTSPPRKYVSHQLIWFTWSSVHPVKSLFNRVTEVILYRFWLNALCKYPEPYLGSGNLVACQGNKLRWLRHVAEEWRPEIVHFEMYFLNLFILGSIFLYFLTNHSVIIHYSGCSSILWGDCDGGEVKVCLNWIQQNIFLLHLYIVAVVLTCFLIKYFWDDGQ